MTENKAIDDLLKPRYKVISDYPGRDVEIGHVINDPDYYERRGLQLKNYPHLFQKLEWYQERDKKDMPHYIKWTHPNTKEVDFFKVDQWVTNSFGVYKAHIYDPAAYLFIKDIQPSTEAEYLNQKQQSHD